jgi:hypothetical protein
MFMSDQEYRDKIIKVERFEYTFKFPDGRKITKIVHLEDGGNE